MRIALLALTLGKVGGTETYIESLIPALIQQGHELSFLTELDHSQSPVLISVPHGVPHWCAETQDSAFKELRAWKPDVLYAHGFARPITDAKMHELGIPVVQYIHNYYGTCISGRKAFANPGYQACTKMFSPFCLVHYFPRSCGGRSPFTMWKYYKENSQRLSMLSLCRKIIVASKHMAAEMDNHHLPSEVISYWPAAPILPPVKDLPVQDELRLLFMGRMEPIKGGQFLLEALPLLETLLDKRLVCHFVGSGTAQKEWEEQAAQIMNQSPNIKVVFHGWLGQAARERIVIDSHLLVVPSVWPEPFGLVGLEAGTLGTPSVAFDIGGISEWLEDGFNGVLASGKSLTAFGLATAIASLFVEPDRYAKLRAGAIQVAQEKFTQKNHMARLEILLNQRDQRDAGPILLT